MKDSALVLDAVPSLEVAVDALQGPILDARHVLDLIVACRAHDFDNLRYAALAGVLEAINARRKRFGNHLLALSCVGLDR